MIAPRVLRLALAVATLWLALAGCGSAEPVTVGEGELPGSVPDDFPIPDMATVGATRVDRIGHRTEFTLEVPRTVDGIAQYYLVGLVSAGYVVQSSGGGEAAWSISFSRDSLQGTVVIAAVGTSAAAVEVSINRP